MMIWTKVRHLIRRISMAGFRSSPTTLEWHRNDTGI